MYITKNVRTGKYEVIPVLMVNAIIGHLYKNDPIKLQT